LIGFISVRVRSKAKGKPAGVEDELKDIQHVSLAHPIYISLNLIAAILLEVID